ncbi:MAG: ASKHA domain-containing protein [Limisphaerales bacterium]
MNPTVRIELLPLGRGIEVVAGNPLLEVLFPLGVEFPCGGRGKCKGCRVRLIEGRLDPTPEDRQILKPEELADGWRLACRARALTDLKIEIAQWEAAILGDDTPFAFHPQEGLGVAVDLGTTTVVVQLLDLRTGRVLGVRTGLNAQARHGADIMSRIDFALAPGGADQLRDLIRRQIGDLIRDLLDEAGREAPALPGRSELRKVVLVGNTVMHHLFCGLNVAPLAHHPFEPEQDGLMVFPAEQLGWGAAGRAETVFLPCLGSFVGSDILAGLLATRLHESAALVALVDLGTNGEMVVGNRDRMLCASTAAGPAFEGARISMGMRAATGAISAAFVEDGALRCEVIGNTAPRGLCGSGLVDVVAGALDLGWILPSGRLAHGARELALVDSVRLSGADVRELQLAKGAIAAGLGLLLEQWGARLEDLTRVHLAGAFGNYINRQSARRIGLLPFGPERTEPAGNTALLGAKLALGSTEGTDLTFAALRTRIRHVSLNDDPRFHEVYVDHMGFPG